MSYEAELAQWRRNRRWALRAIVTGVGVVLLTLLLAGTVQSCRRAQVNSQLKANLHQIQLAVERFAVDQQSYYPMRIGQVVEAGYMPHLPLNPLTGAPMRYVNPAVATRLDRGRRIARDYNAPEHGADSGGVDSVEAIQPGDFAYLPADIHPQNANYAEGYVLLLYELE